MAGTLASEGANLTSPKPLPGSRCIPQDDNGWWRASGGGKVFVGGGWGGGGKRGGEETGGRRGGCRPCHGRGTARARPARPHPRPLASGSRQRRAHPRLHQPV